MIFKKNIVFKKNAIHDTLSKKAEQEGTEEYLKEKLKIAKDTEDALRNTLERDNVILFKAKTFFPFDLFPDTLIIDPLKTTIVYKQFFATNQIMTISNKDLVDIEVDTALFLSTLIVTYLPKTDTPMGMLKPIECVISALKKNDAHKAKNMLKGIQVAQRENIDISNIKADVLGKLIEEFGETKTRIY